MNLSQISFLIFKLKIQSEVSINNHMFTNVLLNTISIKYNFQSLSNGRLLLDLFKLAVKIPKTSISFQNQRLHFNKSNDIQCNTVSRELVVHEKKN